MNTTAILNNLNATEDALRANLHRHDLDANARAHMERALTHAREAFIATNEIGKARTVQELTRDLDAVEQLMEKVRHQRAPGVVSFKMRV